jgi:hypothetical protein
LGGLVIAFFILEMGSSHMIRASIGQKHVDGEGDTDDAAESVHYAHPSRTAMEWPMMLPVITHAVRMSNISTFRCVVDRMTAFFQAR